ncbi:hypothetical protein JMN32_03360 [Fulvivirga sp. 29W222]|uniref:Uncharacterized protein n=1 Tax=Fulvivirga marina TaxID=2494733 RepID=A0A937FT91_9BACT|nr:hypothetical protein [Fulvivirga marina]MBL6445330.1 hypothetical protein [Fulvivirga marina]
MSKDQKLKNTPSLSGFLKRTGIIAVILSFSFSTFSQKVIVKSEEKVIVTDNKQIRKISTSNGLHSFNIEYKGQIEVTDDDKDVKSISPGGYLEISKTTFGSRRSLLIEATSSGLRKEYYEGRTKTDYNPDGKKWLAEILPEVVRSTGIAAESRINRFYRQGGVDAVMDEISRLESDHVRSIYGKLLLKKDELSNSDRISAVKGLSKEIHSDYYLSEMLKDNSAIFLKHDQTAEAYFEAVGGIGSDYYSAIVLKDALREHQTSAASISKIMKASRNIGSDYYQTTVLSNVLEQENIEGPVLAEIIYTSKNIGSDYYQTQVLSKALEKRELSDESFITILDAISDVSSDYYMATVFTKLLDNKLHDNVNTKLIILVDEKMSSDYYASSVLSKLASEQDLNDQSLEQLASAISKLNSSNYAAEVISKAAESKNMSKAKLLPLIKAAGSISSDYYASSALQALAPHVKAAGKEVKDAYRVAAKKINSDTYYGQAIRAID